MSDNINKVVERGAKLEDLEERAGQNLTHKPRGFYISLPVACECAIGLCDVCIECDLFTQTILYCYMCIPIYSLCDFILSVFVLFTSCQ